MQLGSGLEPGSSDIRVRLPPVCYSPISQVRPVPLDAEDEVDQVKHMVIVPRQVLEDVRCTVHVDKVLYDSVS